MNSYLGIFSSYLQYLKLDEQQRIVSYLLSESPGSLINELARRLPFLILDSEVGLL